MAEKGGDAGTSSAYLLRRIARASPETLAAYEAGQFPTVRAAAKAAGIKTTDTVSLGSPRIVEVLPGKEALCQATLYKKQAWPYVRP